MCLAGCRHGVSVTLGVRHEFDEVVQRKLETMLVDLACERLPQVDHLLGYLHRLFHAAVDILDQGPADGESVVVVLGMEGGKELFAAERIAIHLSQARRVLSD